MSRRVLLDTHALLWALSEPDRLGPSARSVVEDVDAVLLASAASAWEITTKHRLGKLPGAEALLVGLDDHLHRLGAVHLPITWRHAQLAGALEWQQRDPFDRMLVAQAQVEQVPIASVDPAVARAPGVEVLW